ncbi:MAG: FkbM family methyltransferase [Deltaproteobacteria bacterium]|nr:FkbM family methyltransferase [Deltaproteobacteria bacterium]
MIRDIARKFMPAKTPEQKAQKLFFGVKLKEADIAIDCGANVGNITKHLCKSGATVYSFEPNPHAFNVLQDRFSDMHNVHCIQKGVSDKKGKMKLYLHENSDKDEVYWSQASSLLDFKGNVRTDRYVEVETIDLCEFIESLNRRVKVLKMDVEGVECRIIEKIICTGVIDKIDYVFVETHDHKIPELQAETNAIRELIKKRKIENINLDWT